MLMHATDAAEITLFLLPSREYMPHALESLSNWIG